MALSLLEAKRRDRLSIPLSAEDVMHLPNDISFADQDTIYYSLARAPFLTRGFHPSSPFNVKTRMLSFLRVPSLQWSKQDIRVPACVLRMNSKM
jgi:hypothetical protein